MFILFQDIKKIEFLKILLLQILGGEKIIYLMMKILQFLMNLEKKLKWLFEQNLKNKNF